MLRPAGPVCMHTARCCHRRHGAAAALPPPLLLLFLPLEGRARSQLSRHCSPVPYRRTLSNFSKLNLKLYAHTFKIKKTLANLSSPKIPICKSLCACCCLTCYSAAPAGSAAARMRGAPLRARPHSTRCRCPFSPPSSPGLTSPTPPSSPSSLPQSVSDLRAGGVNVTTVFFILSKPRFVC